MSRNKKLLIGGIAALVIGVMVYRALAADTGDAVEVRAEVVSRHDLVARVTASGHIEPKRSVDIQSDISGRIVELHVEEGDDVESGDLLLVIDPTQYEAAVRQARGRLSEARSQVARARADYLQYRRDWQRLESLKDVTADLVTDQEVERARTQTEVQEAAMQAAEHTVEQAEASLEEALDRLEKTVIRAPMSGRVTRLNVEQGETAIVGTMNNPGTVLLTVADLEVMEAVLEVDETDIPLVQKGDSASIEIDAFPNRTFAGRVTKISNSALRPRGQTTGSSTDEAVDFEVRVTLEAPPEGIRTDLSATGDIVTDTRLDVLAIPIIALTLREMNAENGEEEGRSDGEIEGAYVVRDGAARFQPVRVGITGDRYFEVLDGLAEGDTVVSGSYQAIRELKDGSRLELAGVTGAPERAEEDEALAEADGTEGAEGGEEPSAGEGDPDGSAGEEASAAAGGS